MNRKNTIYSLFACGLLALSSCSDFTDIQPKGKNLLNRTDDLDMLFNYNLYETGTDPMVLAGDIVFTQTNVPNQLSAPQKTRDIILITWDAANQGTMAELTNSDTQYTIYYKLIGSICNPVLQQIDDAEGTVSEKKRLKSEALTLRAYCHYLLVNKYAKAYNPATAASDRAIIYLTEDMDISVPQQQNTVQQVYDNILKDVNEAIEIDGLPIEAANHMRMNKACAYAVKALALLGMQEYDDAEAAAKQSLELNSSIDNYTQMLTQTVRGTVTKETYNCLLRPQLTCEEDLFHISYKLMMANITTEANTRIETGNVAFENVRVFDMSSDYTTNRSKTTYGLENHLYAWDLNSWWNISGLKTTYMYCTVAEAELHKGNIDTAMEWLDKVREKRIKPETYSPLKGNVPTEAEAMRHVKETWSGEGIWSWYNFINRKRWNQVDGWEETLAKNLNGQTYTLAPGSPMWIFPFPQNVLSNNANIKQNFE